MSLFRQLLLTIILLFTLIFTGTFVITSHFTRDYLNKQLRSHAEDAATSLGLLLSRHTTNKDRSMMVSIVDATFDRGYYQTLNVLDAKGKLLISRTQPLHIDKVPAWFVLLFPMSSPTTTALIMNGWQQEGKVVVRSHPGYAYQKLWISTISTLAWLLLIAAVALIIGSIAIRFLLKPLRAITKQAEGICDQEFTIQETLPRTPELRQVSIAMNRMTMKVKQMLASRTAVSEKLRQRAYQDIVTKLGNRRYFTNHLRHLVTAAEAPIRAAMLQIELQGFDAFVKKHGHTVGDEVLREVADSIRDACGEIKTAFSARIDTDRFAILILNLNKNDLMAMGQQLLDACAQIIERHEPEEAHRVTFLVAIHRCRQGMHVDDLLAAGDMALSHAAESGGVHYVADEYEASEIHAEEEWRTIIEKVVAEKGISFRFQKVLSCDEKTCLHREVFSRLAEQKGKRISVGMFMRMAERLGLAYKVDQLVVSHFIEQAKAGELENDKYALNLSMTALGRPVFIEWLRDILRENQSVLPPVAFEVSEYAAIHNLEAVKHLISILRPFNCRVGLDHFGRAFTAFAYLHGLKIAYVKLDPGYTRDIEHQEDDQFFVRALTDIAHTLDIKVIAQMVETKEQLNVLCDLGVDGIQGKYLSTLET